jgi:hypothetical protein
MAELNELERRLSDLRGDLAVMLREGCTPTQFLKLQRDLIHAWAAVEHHKSQNLPLRPLAAAGGESSQTIAIVSQHSDAGSGPG